MFTPTRTYDVVRETRAQWALREHRAGFPARTLQLFSTEAEARRAMKALVPA